MLSPWWLQLRATVTKVLAYWGLLPVSVHWVQVERVETGNPYAVTTISTSIIRSPRRGPDISSCLWTRTAIQLAFGDCSWGQRMSGQQLWNVRNGATDLFDAGVSLVAIMEFGRWKTAEACLRYYRRSTHLASRVARAFVSSDVGTGNGVHAHHRKRGV